ncbi:hypothetical protein [Micromonospora jinlongensis]|uniref:hypothetical protein n=1 Tax=Micromonospora jinlongensis TaxID=1287877 RepID=UPI003CCCE397
MVSGSTRVVETVKWAADLPDAAWDRLGTTRDAFTVARRVPDDRTLSRVLTGIDAGALDAAVCRRRCFDRPGAAPARPRPAGDLRPASARPAGHTSGLPDREDLGAPPRPRPSSKISRVRITSLGTTRAASLPGRGQGRSAVEALHLVPSREAGRSETARRGDPLLPSPAAPPL